MEFILNDIEARVLGALIEKQMATPDYYPMTLNALVNACNQKTNREPVMDLDEDAVTAALDSLRKRRIVWQVKAHASRALKYEHAMKDIAEFSSGELGILCVLLLRGPQTAGELRSRTARLTEFHGLAAVEHTLKKLMTHEKGPFVMELPRRPGQKENRFMHLFSDIGDVDALSAPATERMAAPAGSPDQDQDQDRLADLEQQVADLSDELARLREEFETFKQQFD